MDIIFKTPNPVVYDNLDQKTATIYVMIEFGVINPQTESVFVQAHFGKDLNGETFNSFRTEKIEVTGADMDQAYLTLKSSLSATEFFANTKQVFALAVKNKIEASSYFGESRWDESNLDGTAKAK